MPSQTRVEEFVQLLTAQQPRLFTFILTLVGDASSANDILQEANLVLWRKAEEFTPGSNFSAWASAIAHFQVLAYLRDAKREQLLFDDETIAEIALDAERTADEVDLRRIALSNCMEKLSGRQREMIAARYTEDKSIETISIELGRSLSAIAMALSRARQALFNCIEKVLAREAGL